MIRDGPLTPQSSPYTEKTCFVMLQNHAIKVPKECEMFQEIKIELQRRNSSHENQAIAFQGMDAGEAAAARAAREHGGLYGAQLQRRMTSERYMRSW